MSFLSKKNRRSLLPLIIKSLMIASGLILCNGGVLHASPTTNAFNTGTGTLNIDYAGYLSKHDVVVNGMIVDLKNGLTVGNGRVGAMLSNQNGLTLQIQGVDNSEHTCFSSGFVNLYTSPGMDSGYSTYQQRLNLYDGVLTVKYDSNRTVTVMGAPNSEVLGIHVDDSRSGVSAITLDLGIWSVSGLPSSSSSMYCDVPDMGTWKTVSTYNDTNGAGISRGQTDSFNFGYTIAASVEGASFTTSVVNSNMVRLTITPSSSYTIWIANATRLNASGNDSVTRAKNLLTSTKSTGYSATLSNFKTWWHNFWSKSFVQYSNNGDADYMENAYYLYNYMIAAGAYANYPFHFINGAFSGVNDSDYGKWSGAYWYWNQRDVYNSFWASNRADAMESFLNLYNRNFNTLKSFTSSQYGIDGIWVPETMGFDGNARHTMESDYTRITHSTGAEVALNMYAKYKYTNDSAYLSNTAYPFMREVCKCYSKQLSYDGSKYYMANSNAHETYWNVKNAITDLAAVRALFPIAIKTSTALNVDSSLRSEWQTIVDNLVAFPTDGSNYLACENVPGSHNNENVACEVIWPYSLVGIGDSMATNTWNNRPFKYGNVWSPDAIQAARLGMGDNVYAGMKTMLQKYQNLPNGRTTNGNGEFEYIGVHLAAMNEALVHSYNDKIKVFPAIAGGLAAKFTLLASGGFLVSSEMESNEIKYVGIKSLYGNTATMINPWGTQQVQVRRVSDNSILLTTSGAEFNFATAANTVYVVERTAKLLSSYTYEQLTGTANQNVKSLSGTSSKLGTDAQGDVVTITTFYKDTGYSGTAVSLNAGSYTTSQLSSAGIADNWASSVKMPPGYTVDIYDEDNFTGTKWTFTANNSDFLSAGCNDRMSSVVITASSSTPVPTPDPTAEPTTVGTPAPTEVPTATPAPTETPAPTTPGETVAPTTPPAETVAPTTPPTETPAPTSPPATGCTCTAKCDEQTAISVPFTYDGAGEYCWTSSSLATYVNSWNCDAVNINGTNCTNTYVSSSSIASIGGVFYIYYKASYSWSHFEAR